MRNDTTIELSEIRKFEEAQTGIIREGARQLLRMAVAAEPEKFLQPFEDRRTGQGRRAVVRGGRPLSDRSRWGGPVRVRIPKVRSSDDKPVTFRSSLVSP